MCDLEVLENDFDKFSERIVRNFLRTAISIDDEPVYENDNKVSNLIDPDASMRNIEGVTAGDEFSNRISKNINIPDLTKAFIDEQILYTSIKPEVPSDTPEQFVKKYYNIANKSDIIILDWELYNNDKEGKYIQALIRKIIEENNLKLIVIYSATDHYSDIIPEKLIKLSGKEYNEETKNKFIRDSYSVCCKGIKIKFVHKNKEYIDDTVPSANVEELPQLCINEFTKLINGLLPNAVVSAITSIRNNTFNIISRFPTEFDANYINHRINLPKPDDAEDFLFQLICDEIIAAINFDNIRKCISCEIIKNKISKNDYENNINGHICDLSELAELGKFDYIKKHEGYFSKKYYKFTKNYSNKELTDDDIGKLELKFSAFAITNTKYYSKDRLPYLTLGSIIAIEEEAIDKCTIDKTKCKISCDCNKVNKYYLCIQPRCDSVRIAEDTPLLFVPLKDIEIENEKEKHKINISFYDEKEKNNKILVFDNVSDIVLKKFKITQERVYANIDSNGNFIFQAINGDKYRWVADLKFSFAQRIIEQISHIFSRVGVDHYEWFRNRFEKEL